MTVRHPDASDWSIRELRDAIERDGRGIKRFSREVLVRPPSTVYRWLSGSKPIPKVGRDWLVGDFRITVDSEGADQ